MSAPAARREVRVCFVDSFLAGSEQRIPKQSELVAELLVAAGATVLKTSGVRNRYLRVLDITRFLIRNRRSYDVICVQAYRRSFGVTVLATALGRVLRKRVVAVLRGGKIPELAGRRPAAVNWVFARADRIVAPSGYLQAAVRALGYDAEVVPNAVEIDRYPFRHRTTAAPRILWIRSFHEIYNPWLAISAFARIRSWYPDATLTMAGPDLGALDECRHLASELGVDGGVSFVGYLRKAEIGEVGSRHDIFLNTSRMDNVPVTVLEALAGGLCVVSTDVDGMPFLLDDGEDALLVPSDAPDAMAEAVRRLLDVPELAGRLSRAARRKAEGFDAASLVPRWLSVLDGRKAPLSVSATSPDPAAAK